MLSCLDLTIHVDDQFSTAWAMITFAVLQIETLPVSRSFAEETCGKIERLP